MPTNHRLDTDEKVFFYENDFYVLSNFSAFELRFKGYRWATSEHAYHGEKFKYNCVPWHAGQPQDEVWTQLWIYARSAHDAFKIAEANKHLVRPDWQEVRVDVMREILRTKAEQHEYVRRKLLATGDRELVEDSWRDSFWGIGPDGDGQNQMGKLWMEIRAELREKLMSLECGECERDMRGGHDPECSLFPAQQAALTPPSTCGGKGFYDVVVDGEWDSRLCNGCADCEQPDAD